MPGTLVFRRRLCSPSKNCRINVPVPDLELVVGTHVGRDPGAVGCHDSALSLLDVLGQEMGNVGCVHYLNMIEVLACQGDLVDVLPESVAHIAGVGQ